MHSCKTTEYNRIDSPPCKCNVLRESLSVDSQNIPCATLKRRRSWVVSVYLWANYWALSVPESKGNGSENAVTESKGSGSENAVRYQRVRGAEVRVLYQRVRGGGEVRMLYQIVRGAEVRVLYQRE
jgi:hypothetical protein